MKNKKWLRVGIVLTIILIGVGIFLFINFRPVAQAEQRAKEDNQWLDEKKRLYEEEKKSPDYAEHQKKYRLKYSR